MSYQMIPTVRRDRAICVSSGSHLGSGSRTGHCAMTEGVASAGGCKLRPFVRLVRLVLGQLIQGEIYESS